MIAITDYTSYASVRAALGIDDLEISDVTLGDDFYAQSLELSLRSESPEHSVGGTGNLISRFDTISDIAEGSRTDDEAFLLTLISLYATYSVAFEILPKLSLIAKRSESDGKASATRFSSEATFRDVVVQITDRKADTLRAIRGLTLEGADYTAPDLLSVVAPETDIIAESPRESS